MSRLLTIRQCAKELNISYGNCYLKVKEGSIKSVKVGKAIRIKPEYLNEYLGVVPTDTGHCLRQGLKTTLEDTALEIIREYLAQRFEAFEQADCWTMFSRR